jgi:hypothetical protein
MPAGAVAAIDLRPESAMSAAGGTPVRNNGLFGFDTTQAIAGADYFGPDLNASMTLAQRNAWRAAMDTVGVSYTLDPAGTTLLQMLTRALGDKADPGHTARCKPVMPTLGGRIEIWLGSAGKVLDRDFLGAADTHWPTIQATEQTDYRSVRLRCLAFATAIDNCTEGDGSLAARLCAGSAARNGISFAAAQADLAQRFRDKYKRYLGGLVRKYALWTMGRTLFIPPDLTDEGELPPETTITDNFNRADADPLGSSSEGWSWTEVEGDIDIVSNQGQVNSSSGWAVARAESDLSSSDHYAQSDAVSITGTNFEYVCGGAVRFNSSANTHYLCMYGFSEVALIIFKKVAGTGTELGRTSITTAFPEPLKMEVNGSALKAYQSGTQRVSLTDTSITGNTRTGVSMFRQTGASTFDNFQAADLAAGGAVRPPYYYRHLAGGPSRA